ncbi:MAG: tetratricopeptide repeat protein [Oscillospiraceae bacterium]|nr:tetratricopeptide repeat protein [Oscillospiraceae bacterium]
MIIKKAAALFTSLLLVLSMTSCHLVSGDKLARKGKEYYSAQEYSKAEDTFLQAEETGLKFFSYAELYYHLGNCRMKQDDVDGCIKYQKKAIEANPEYFGAWVSLGVSYRKTGDKDKAMECYKTALEYDPQNSNSAPLYISLGVAYLEMNKPVSAVTYLEKAKELRSEQADIYAFLAIAYAMELEPERSDEAYSKALELGYSHMDQIEEQLDKIGRS